MLSQLPEGTVPVVGRFIRLRHGEIVANERFGVDVPVAGMSRWADPAAMLLGADDPVEIGVKRVAHEADD